MKRLSLSLLLSLVLFCIPSYKTNANEHEPDYKLIYDTLLTTLDPYIEEGVANYYGYMKQYGLYDAKILNITREREGSFSFQVKIQVTTFEAAHNPPYGKEIITFSVDPFGVKIVDFSHEGDKVEKQIEKFNEEVISDIQQSFHLNLEPYTRYSYNQLQYLSEKQKEFSSLFRIVENIVVSILNPEINPPYKNVVNPVTFIKDSKGYILFKMADGTNVMYEVKRKNDSWTVVEQKRKQGKIMKKELLWYM